MPEGSFAIILPKESDYKILGYYFKKSIDFNITGDLFLRLNLDHERNEINLLRLKDLIIFSYLYHLKGKIALKASSLIIGLILDEEDDPETFRTPLKEYAENLGELDLMSLSQEKFEIELKKLYQEHIEKLTDILDPDVIKRSVINKTKEMLSGGKK